MLASTSKCVARNITTTTFLKTQFDKRVFIDPILKKPLPPDDPRQFLYPKPMRNDQTPVFYRDHIVDKLIRTLERYGEKETVRKKVYSALEMVKRKQYALYLEAKSDEERSKIILDPIVLTNKAINNCRPLMKLMDFSRGGLIYQVPFPIEEKHAVFMALRMLKHICKAKIKNGAYHLDEILCEEILAASKNEGFTIQAKQEHHRLCEANRAFSHYRK